MNDPVTATEWMVRSAHLRQMLHAQRRISEAYRRRAERAEKDVTFYAGQYEEVLRLCRRAGFNPYYYENVEGQ